MPIKKRITMTELSVLRLDYVRGANTVPIEFEVTDYVIPSGVKAFFISQRREVGRKESSQGRSVGRN